MGVTSRDNTKPQDEELDDALDDTFPASDPVATGGVTGPEDKGPADTLEELP